MRRSRWVGGAVAALMLVGGLAITAGTASAADGDCSGMPQELPILAPPGNVLTSYSRDVQVPGTSYTYATAPGAQPPLGLSITSTGTLHGTPLLVQGHTWRVNVTQPSTGCTGSIELTIVIHGASAGGLGGLGGCLEALLNALGHAPPGGCYP